MLSAFAPSKNSVRVPNTAPVTAAIKYRGDRSRRRARKAMALGSGYSCCLVLIMLASTYDQGLDVKKVSEMLAPMPSNTRSAVT